MSSSQEMPALESLRTVEFRQTLRGYHIDDVDEYLERVAVEAEALQEQMRQTADRLRQATDRIVALESQVGGAADGTVSAAPRPSDDSLQRTLLMAQKFVEETETEAREQARVVLDEAQRRAGDMVAEAEQRAQVMAEESEKHLREEVARLEGQRTKLAADVEAITRYLETERARLRGALGDMLRWVDESVQPQPPAKSPAGESRSPSEPASSGEGRGTGADVRHPADEPDLSAGGMARSGLQTVSQGNVPNGAPSR